MATIKEEILKTIQSLPDETTFDDVFYHLYLLHKIKTGKEQAQRGELIDHDDVVRESEQW